jgi:hypothetical protein
VKEKAIRGFVSHGEKWWCLRHLRVSPDEELPTRVGC